MTSNEQKINVETIAVRLIGQCSRLPADDSSVAMLMMATMTIVMMRCANDYDDML